MTRSCYSTSLLSTLGVLLLLLSVMLVPSNRALGDNGVSGSLVTCPGDSKCNNNCVLNGMNTCCDPANAGDCSPNVNCTLCRCNPTLGCASACLCYEVIVGGRAECHCGDRNPPP